MSEHPEAWHFFPCSMSDDQAFIYLNTGIVDAIDEVLCTIIAPWNPEARRHQWTYHCTSPQGYRVWRRVWRMGDADPEAKEVGWVAPMIFDSGLADTKDGFRESSVLPLRLTLSRRRRRFAVHQRRRLRLRVKRGHETLDIFGKSSVLPDSLTSTSLARRCGCCESETARRRGFRLEGRCSLWAFRCRRLRRRSCR